jgi:hypothetical protein
LNQDIEQLCLGPPVVDHVYDSSNNTESVPEQVDDLESPVEEDNKVKAPEVSVPVPPTLKKRGCPKGSKNRTINNIFIENRYITRSTRF